MTLREKIIIIIKKLLYGYPLIRKEEENNMVTSGSPHYGYWGLSGENKPSGEDVQNGAAFTEIDTGKNFLYDKENDTWYEQPSGGGGGGSSIEDVTSDVIFNINSNVTFDYLKAYKNGDILMFYCCVHRSDDMIAASTTLFSVKEDYSPKGKMAVIGSVETSSNPNTSTVYITQSSDKFNVTNSGGVAQDKKLIFNFTYPVIS